MQNNNSEKTQQLIKKYISLIGFLESDVQLQKQLAN